MKVQKHLNNIFLVKINTLILSTNEIRPFDLSLSSFFSDSFFFLKLKDWNVNKIKFWIKVFNFQTKGTKKDFWKTPKPAKSSKKAMKLFFYKKRLPFFHCFNFGHLVFNIFQTIKLNFFLVKFLYEQVMFFFFLPGYPHTLLKGETSLVRGS